MKFEKEKEEPPMYSLSFSDVKELFLLSEVRSSSQSCLAEARVERVWGRGVRQASS